MTQFSSRNRSWRTSDEFFIWGHLALLAGVPWLSVAALRGLACGDLWLPAWLELVILLLPTVGLTVWLQWSKPLSPFSWWFVAVPWQDLTENQLRVFDFLSPKTNPSFATGWLAVLVGIANVLVMLWSLHFFPSLQAASVLSNHFVGLVVALLCLWLANFWLQAGVSALRILLSANVIGEGTSFYTKESVRQDFTHVDMDHTLVSWIGITKKPNRLPPGDPRPFILPDLRNVEAERLAFEQEQARLLAERLALEEQARLEAERLAFEQEQARLLAERLALEEQARLEAERLAFEQEQARLLAERLALEEQARLEAERLALEEKARLEAERLEREEQARLLVEQLEREEQARLLAEQLEREEQARLLAEQLEREEQARLLAEQLEREEQARLLEAKRLAFEQEQAQIEAELLAFEQEQARLEAERLERETQPPVIEVTNHNELLTLTGDISSTVFSSDEDPNEPGAIPSPELSALIDQLLGKLNPENQ